MHGCFFTQKMQLHFLATAIPPPVPLMEGDRGRLRQIRLSKYSHTLRGMHRFCPACFFLSPDRNFQGQALSKILQLSRKIKTKCIFRSHPSKTFFKVLRSRSTNVASSAKFSSDMAGDWNRVKMISLPEPLGITRIGFNISKPGLGYT